jgi:hypothetical protein
MRFRLATFVAATTFAGLARGGEPSALFVERGEGASECPDEGALLRSVDEVRGRATPPDALRSYRVAFARRGDAFHARIESTVDESSRSLTDGGPTCAALARATAVTLALLLDAEPTPVERRSDDEATTTTEQRAARGADSNATSAQTVPPDHATRSAAAHAFTLDGGAGLLGGVVRPIAPFVRGGAGLELRHFDVNVGALFVPPGDVELPPGSLSTSLLAITLESCLELASLDRVTLHACSGLIAGFIRAEARGYTLNEARSRAWLAVPAGVGVGTEGGSVGLRFDATLLVPIRRQNFQVDGAGIAYRSPVVAGLLSLRAVARLPF